MVGQSALHATRPAISSDRLLSPAQELRPARAGHHAAVSRVMVAVLARRSLCSRASTPFNQGGVGARYEGAADEAARPAGPVRRPVPRAQPLAAAEARRDKIARLAPPAHAGPWELIRPTALNRPTRIGSCKADMPRGAIARDQIDAAQVIYKPTFHLTLYMS
jgi:hypothetical protein